MTTTYRTPTSVAASAGNRPARGRLDLPPLVWALAATHFVSRAGGLVRSFLVLYLTQEQQLSLATAAACLLSRRFWWVLASASAPSSTTAPATPDRF